MTASSDNRAPAPVTRPGFYEVRTPDPERLVHYYEDALDLVVTERSGSATYLTTGVDHHCVIVQQGERDGRAAVGFEVAGSLTDVQRDLKKLGVDAQLRTDPQPMIRAALTLPEPETQTPIYLYQSQTAEQGQRGADRAGHQADQARPHRVVRGGPRGRAEFLHRRARFPVVRHHRGLLHLPALQRRPPRHQPDAQRLQARAVPRRLRDARHRAPQGRPRPPGQRGTSGCSGDPAVTAPATTSSPTITTPTATWWSSSPRSTSSTTRRPASSSPGRGTSTGRRCPRSGAWGPRPPTNGVRSIRR